MGCTCVFGGVSGRWDAKDVGLRFGPQASWGGGSAGIFHQLHPSPPGRYEDGARALLKETLCEGFGGRATRTSLISAQS